MSKKLSRSEKNKVVGGVAGGLGEYFDIDPTVIRLIFVLITFAGGSGVLIYLILWLIIPSKGNTGDLTEETIKYNATEIKEKANKFASDLKTRYPHPHSRRWFGLIVILVGIVLLAENFGYRFWFFRSTIFWPAAIILFGLLILNRE